MVPKIEYISTSKALGEQNLPQYSDEKVKTVYSVYHDISLTQKSATLK